MTDRDRDTAPAQPSTPPRFFVLDRVVDGRWAVLEADGSSEGDGGGASGSSGDEPPLTLTLPLGWLPVGVREGDVLRIETVAGGRDARVTLTRDEDARSTRAGRLDALRQAIPRGPSGDITL